MKCYLVKIRTTGEKRENLSKDEVIRMIIEKEILYNDFIWEEGKKLWVEFLEHDKFS